MISSTNNAAVRSTAKLRKRREREKRRAFLIEGHRAVAAALAAGVRLPAIFHTSGADVRRGSLIEEARGAGAKLHEVSGAVMTHLTAHDHAPDLVAVAPMRPAPLERAMSGDFVVVLDGVRDPAVAGGVMAAAAGAGAGAVIGASGTTDLFAPACVRAGAGAHFVLAVAQDATPASVASKAKDRRVVVLGDDGIGVAKADLSRPLVLVVHDESSPVPDAFRTGTLVCVPAGAGGVRAGLAARAAVALHEATRE